jgi:hypothetical protein
MKNNSKKQNARSLQGKVGRERCAQKSRKRYRRSDTKVITIEAKVLKFFREPRHLSMRKAATLIGFSDTFVCHCEQGRIDLKPAIVAKFLHVYGYDYGHFQKLVTGQIEMPEDLMEECVLLLKKLNKDKLKTVKSILQSF